MKKLKFLPLILILCLLSGLLLAPTAMATGPDISAPSAILLDSKTGEILFEKGADEEVYPASITKIMTVLLAVEAVEAGKISLDEMVAGTSHITYDLSSLGSTAGISVGESMRFEDLLYCAMLSSANEACNIIAERVSGIISYFVDLMNTRAKQLGCTDTNFVNTHGLQSSLHRTTARDYSLIALEASKHELFMKLCGTAKYTVPATNYWGERTLNNSNALLCAESMYGSGYVYEGCTGMKTGHTSYAKYCLVSTAERNGTELLCLLFGAESSDACFRDSAKLLDWGFENHVTIITPEFLTNAQPAVIAAPRQFAVAGELNVEIASPAAVVLNQENGEIFFAKAAEQQVAPADLTKLMTALLATEAIEAGSFSLSSEVTVTGNAFSDLSGSSTRLLYEGETLPMESLLYCALLSSADDACNAIAEYVGGSVENFVRMMNARAQQLGCTDTNFVNTHGLHSDAQYTTAYDFSLIALEASRHDLLMRICGTKAAELPETNKSAARTVRSTNALLTEDSPYGAGYLYSQASGMKTGYNNAAGYCLAATAKDSNSGISLVSVIFGGDRAGGTISCFSDTVSLYDNIFENYSYQEVLRSTENIASVDIALGSDTDFVNLRPANSISLLLPKDYDRDDFKMELTVYSISEGRTLTAPISAGEVLGEVSVYRDGRNYGTVKLVASTNVDLSRVQYLKASIAETTQSKTFRLIFTAVVLFFAAYLAWVIVYRVRRIKHLLAIRELERVKGQADELRAAAEAPAAPSIEFVSAAPAAPEAEEPQPREPKITVFPAEKPAAPQSPAPPAAPEAPAVPAAPKAPAAPAAPTKVTPATVRERELSVLQDQADRDYFEEFFRKK